jgi:hypothetical protein
MKRETQVGAANVTVGTKVTILNKYGDEIAEGKIIEVERGGFTLDTGDAVPFWTIASIMATEIRLTVTGAQL